MPTDEPSLPKVKPSRTGIAIAITLNVLVILSVVIVIPIEQSKRMDLAIPLLAFCYQMGALGVIAFCCSVGDLVINRRRGNRRGTTLAVVGMVLSALPQPLGSALVHIAARVLGWHVDF